MKIEPLYKKRQRVLTSIVKNRTMRQGFVADFYYNNSVNKSKPEGWIYLLRWTSTQNEYREVHESKIIEIIHY